MLYTRRFWFGVQCALLVLVWHTLLQALGKNGEIMSEVEILAVKDEIQRPIPSAWRQAFREVVSSFVVHDYLISRNILGLIPVSQDTAEQIETYIQDYGEKLVELPEQTWDSSVCMWMESYWDVLVDLWTENEGLSDLVLKARVFESQEGHEYQIEMVYVP